MTPGTMMMYGETFLQPPHDTTPATIEQNKSKKKIACESFRRQNFIPKCLNNIKTGDYW